MKHGPLSLIRVCYHDCGGVWNWRGCDQFAQFTHGGQEAARARIGITFDNVEIVVEDHNPVEDSLNRYCFSCSHLLWLCMYLNCDFFFRSIRRL